MEPCLCSAIRHLASEFDEAKAKNLTPSLNQHLTAVWSILSKSKSFARDLQYHITPSNHRTIKVLSIQSIDTARIDSVFERFKDDIEGFWLPSDDNVHAELRRRLVCMAIFLRSRLDPEASVPPQISRFVDGQNYADLRYAGRKYIKMARKLGSIGSIFWLPLDIPASTYERYINIDDEQIFNHLKSIRPKESDYNSFVQQLLLTQLDDPSLPASYLNLFSDYSDILPGSEKLLLLLHALGGKDIPLVLLQSVSKPQRRWSLEGEMQSTTAITFGLPIDIINLLSDETCLAEAATHQGISKGALDDGMVTLSISSELKSSFQDILLPEVSEELSVLALRLICYASPPCYECNTDWSVLVKKAVWKLLEGTIDQRKVAPSLRMHLVEALLYFAERDSLGIRRLALERAKLYLSKSMPYHLHASVALFQSFVHRLEGDITKADTKIRNFLSRSQQPATRIDHALRGRLHISQIDNKIKRYDDDVPANIYGWEGQLPLSTLESEVAFRLQSAVGKYLLSVGDFRAAQSSLDQYLRLNEAKTVPANSITRRLIVSRLADMDCELGEFDKAMDILAPALENIGEKESTGRAYVRLMLSSVDAKIGQGRLDIAASLLQKLSEVGTLELDDLTNQILHMRTLMAVARIAHEQLQWEQALDRWKFVLQEMEQLVNFKAKHGFVASVVHLSMAHIQLRMGDKEDAKQSWAAGTEILKTKRCEFWIPIVATSWLAKVVREVHQLQGWSFRMMLPGKKPDATWP